VTPEEQKKAAAQAAVDLVRPGMKIGLGTGSTANYFIDLLGAKVRDGFDVKAVPTSRATYDRAKNNGITLITLEEHPRLDLTVDGADEFDGNFNLIKGGGGALLMEKIVASSSRYMFVIADESKRVTRLGKHPLPIEVVPFGFKATAWKIENALKSCNLAAKLTVRVKDGKPFQTDAGHIIIDAAIGWIPDPVKLSNLLNILPGVVDHGLFIGICGRVLLGTKDGVKQLDKPSNTPAVKQRKQ
jgi:ribose 5-phosphate isomerase A